MEVLFTECIHHTPLAAELFPNYQMKCTEANCESIFTNIGNFEMHLQRHHKLPLERKDQKVFRLYHCPDVNCAYNASQEHGKHFTNMKYLRQHFQKVHMEKIYICEHCGKRFATTSQLQNHSNNDCGKKFTCKECGWVYESMGALLTHGKRKRHNIGEDTQANEDITNTLKLPLPRIPKQKLVALNDQLQNHSNNECEKKFTCKECGWGYESMQALFTHGKRKRHNIGDVTQANEDISKTLELPLPYIPKQKLIALNDHKVKKNQGAQTDVNPVVKLTGNRQSNPFSPPLIVQELPSTNVAPIAVCVSPINDFPNELDAFLRNIETQTEWSNCGSPNSANNSVLLDQMLAQSSHMYTQTCDELLSELGLADIQTQTNWPEGQHQYASTATSPTRCTHDDLLVSTETQTSFTQCLFDSHNSSTSVSDGPFSSLCNTQYTQTCDLLLTEIFGPQENDLINGFQSTYTQT